MHREVVLGTEPAQQRRRRRRRGGRTGTRCRPRPWPRRGRVRGSRATKSSGDSADSSRVNGTTSVASTPRLARISEPTLERRDRRGRRVRAQHDERVRVERQDRGADARCPRVQRGADHDAVAQVHAVERADRDRVLPAVGRDLVEPVPDLHGQPSGRLAPGATTTSASYCFSTRPAEAAVDQVAELGEQRVARPPGRARCGRSTSRAARR